MNDVVIKPLGPADLTDATALLTILNPTVDAAILTDRLSTIFTDHPHYRLTGAFVSGKLAGLCGAWIATKIWSGKYLELDNLVVDPAYRSANIGTTLIRHFEDIAREEQCTMMTLDSYTSNHPSHRLYHRLGFEIWGFHFVKPLK